MSGLTLSDIRAALKAQLDAKLTGRDQTVHAHPQGDYTYPAIVIDLDDGDSIDYWETFGPGGLACVRFVVLVETAGLDKESASIARDDYLSVGSGNGSSIIDAVHADPTLGLVGCTAKASLQGTDRASVTAEFLVEVHIHKVGAEA
jgi:hypothetical protein